MTSAAIVAVMMLFGSPPGLLELTVAPGSACFDPAGLEASIRRCWLPEPGRAASVEVEITRHGDRHDARLRLRLGALDLGDRHLGQVEGSCREVARTVAAAVCVALDPTVVATVQTRRHSDAPWTRAPVRAPELWLPTIRALEESSIAAPEPRASLTASVTVAGGLEAGSLAGAAPAIRIGADIEGGAWSLGCDLGVGVAPRREVHGAFVTTTLTTAGLTACGSFRALRVCAVARLGGHVVDAFGLVGDGPDAGGFAAVGGRLALVLPGPAGLIVAADLLGAPWRSEFVATTSDGSVRLFRPEVWAVVLTIGARFSLDGDAEGAPQESP